MDAFEVIREKAVLLHEGLVALGANPRDPVALVQAAVDQFGLELAYVSEGDPILKGARALYDEQSGTILATDDSDPAVKAGLVAHEVGHICIHAGSSECHAGDIDPGRSTESAPVGLQRVEDYGAKERRELQADVFAREFLLPRKIARELHLAGQGATAISGSFKLAKNLVRQQLLDALLLPPAEFEPAKVITKRDDPSQDRAASHTETAYLLEAGPGTGKTSTLIKRILFLIGKNVDPASILVLTYSNRAAGELSERLMLAVPDAAPKIWIGTFHAFGLDLVRRYHDKFGLPADPPLFDRSDAIEVLEEILPTLPLKHYRNLWDPAMELREIVNAISRAKDELADAADYQAKAQEAYDEAVALGDEKQKEDAEKSLEVASVYKLYEKALKDRATVDFGDLIMRPTLLLESDKVVAATLRLRHRHVLVDEYQDVNRASARFLQALAEDGSRLWVVGDARQSIYRFRGASSVNMARFTDEYPNAKRDQLEINYRSSEEIKNAFEAVAPHMAASRGVLPLKLTAAAGSSGISPQLRSFDTQDDEVAGIASSVKELEAAGTALRDQAILCRTNARLNEIAFGLECRGIPVLHLGSLFEREEIRDLLALLSILVDPLGSGLARVGAMPRYAMPLQDEYLVLCLLKETPGNVVPRLTTLSQDATLSDAGRKGLKKLADDLVNVSQETTAWEFLTSYLLDRTDLIAALGRESGVPERMKAVAIWQFLNFVRDQSQFGFGLPIQRVLNRVRSLVLLSEERDLRQIPPSALHMNAVRLMTVHGSKGLEFSAVHLPGMTVAGFPSSYRGQRCPPPKGLVEGTSNLSASDAAKAGHEEEEQCLFFVAISRAKLHLRLYNSRKQPGGRGRKASPYLDWIKPAHLSDMANPPAMPLPPDAPRPVPIVVTWHPDWQLTHFRLGSFDRCPRRFFYTHVLGLGGAKKATPFNQAHNCLYELIDWLAEARLKGAVNQADAFAELDRLWLAKGPVDHAFAQDYRQLADRIAEALLKSIDGRNFLSVEPLPLVLPAGMVMVIPDGMTVRTDGVVTLHRTRTGYKRSDEYDRLEYTLFHLAAKAKYGGGYIIEALHLSDDVSEEATVTDAKQKFRKELTEAHVAKIAAGQFPPEPDPVSCPRCPHFFICAAVGHGPLQQI